MDEQFYLINYVYTVLKCKPMIRMAVISEFPMDVVKRTQDRYPDNAFEITQFMQISKQQYLEHRNLNPKRGSYIQLKQDDIPDQETDHA